jgi:hypothetical protein
MAILFPGKYYVIHIYLHNKKMAFYRKVSPN